MGIENCLAPVATTITKETILQVQELVLSRKIYNVRYQMEYARIFDEAPCVAGSSTLINNEDGESTLQASVTYTDQKSYSFTRSLSLSAGISSTIEAGVPFITKASITVDYHINGAFEWGETTTTSTSVTGTAMVPVPAKSSVTVDFVGTRGTCNIPYSYTQEDKRSSDGKVVYTNLYDGIYTGVSYYNFSFTVRETKAL
ncbi:natterin-1-like [Salvia hispanica]|uniref:natterin-1-like n=1 Tax=Salvia hispanica TaxID=49212 RepID=UPI0020094E53|nr:natterin-1-like [Salvia hispanica]